MLNANEINTALVTHSAVIESAVLDMIENSDFRTYGLLEDLVSECTLHLLATALPKFRGPRYGLAKFIKTTCRFRTANTIKKHETTRADMYASFDDVASPAPIASAAIERQLEAARLTQALATLCPESQAVAEQLAAGKTQKDAAKALKMSAPTMTRRRKALASQLSLALN